MENEQWTKAIDESELKEGIPQVITVGKTEVLLVRIEGTVHACGSKCTHYGAPLKEGELTNHTLTCPWHNSTFDITTGKMVLPPAINNLASYPVKIENGQVFVGKPTMAGFPESKTPDNRTFAIIGAGAAGNIAAETLRREGFTGKILLITAEQDRPYDRPSLSKEYLAGTSKPEWIPLRPEKFYKQHQIDLLLDHKVTAINPKLHTISFQQQEQITYDRLLLATGGIPQKLDVPGSDLEGVFLLRSLADANAIIHALDKCRKAVIIGTGFIGMEAAAAFRNHDIDVHVISKDKSPMENNFGDRISAFLKNLHEKNGVKFHLEKRVNEISGKNRVESVALSDSTRIQADLVLVGLGITPAVDYLEGTGLLQDGAVPVNQFLQTKDPDIFAVGDIAIVPTPPQSEPLRIEHWIVAERQGQHAARTMLGSTTPYPEIPFFWTKQYDISIRYIGHAKNYDQIIYRGNVEEGKFLAGYYQNDTLKAVAGLKQDKEIINLCLMLKAGASISPDEFKNEKIALAEFSKQ